jgi:hypothetical protein
MRCLSFVKQARRSSLLALAAMTSSSMLVSSAVAGALSTSASAPSADIVASQLTDLGPGPGDGGRNYTDNGGPPGQTFQVTSSGLVNRITVLGRGDSSGGWNNGPIPFTGTEIWALQVASVDTGTGALTTIATETATGFVAPANIADYLTFTLATPINLSTGNTYAFSLYTSGAGGPGTDGGWFGIAHSTADVYAGGVAINNNTSIANPGGNAGGPRRDFPAPGFAAPVPDGYDYVFAVQGVVPEPASMTLLAFAGFGLGALRRRK